MTNIFFLCVSLPDGRREFLGPFPAKEKEILESKFKIDPVIAPQPLGEVVMKVLGGGPIISFIRFMFLKEEERNVGFKVIEQAQRLITK